nr:unnamed protein product [Callosobruchus analis]
MNVFINWAVYIVKTCCVLQNFIHKEESFHLHNVTKNQITLHVDSELTQLPMRYAEVGKQMKFATNLHNILCLMKVAFLIKINIFEENFTANDVLSANFLVISHLSVRKLACHPPQTQYNKLSNKSKLVNLPHPPIKTRPKLILPLHQQYRQHNQNQSYN